jgi:LAO/AO transport system kinase
MTDHFIHLHQPMSGDELQGIKKGVMELADLVIVTKSDGPMETAARLAKVEIERALSLTRIDHSDIPKVYLSSILNSKGNEDIWKAILELQEKRFLNGYISRKREEQNKNWLAQEITTSLKELLESHPNYDLELSNSQLALSKNNTLCGSIARNFVSKLVKLNSI